MRKRVAACCCCVQRGGSNIWPGIVSAFYLPLAPVAISSAAIRQCCSILKAADADREMERVCGEYNVARTNAKTNAHGRVLWRIDHDRETTRSATRKCEPPTEHRPAQRNCKKPSLSSSLLLRVGSEATRRETIGPGPWPMQRERGHASMRGSESKRRIQRERASACVGSAWFVSALLVSSRLVWAQLILNLLSFQLVRRRWRAAESNASCTVGGKSIDLL